MASAQDDAFTMLICRRGLLSPEAVEQARQGQSPDAPEPLANLLVQIRMLAPTDASDVLRELARGRYACKRCGQSLSYDALASLARLQCPSCAGPLVLQSPPATGRFPSAPRHRHPTGIIPGKQEWDLSETVIEKGSGTKYPPGAETFRGPAPPQTIPRSNQRTLGEYLVERELGRGSNGVVYLARRKGLERRFALKVLLEDFTRDDEGVKRFQLEAAIASKLQDSGIIGVYDVGREGENYYYAMEYCPGLTLQELIARDGSLEPVEAAEILQKLARTLEKAHAQQVLHRDLKPANIIMDQRGRPRVTDFGLARDRSLASSMTQEGDILGTPYYMSPEQLRGSKSLNHRSDIYALGVILYECLTGQRPFKARTPMMLADLIVRGACAPPRSLDPTIPKPLEAICKKAMAVSADDRYQTCAELADALEAYLQTERGSWLRRGRRKKKKRKTSDEAESSEGKTQMRAVAIGLAALLVVGLGTGAAVMVRQRQVRDQRAADVEKTLASVAAMAAETTPAPTDRMRAELDRIEPLAADNALLAAQVRRAKQVTRGWEALEQARALESSPETWGRQEEALSVARREAGDDPLLIARVEAEERRHKASRALSNVIRRSQEAVGFRTAIVAAFDAVLEQVAGMPGLSRKTERALITYLMRRCRYQDAEDRARSFERRTQLNEATFLRLLAVLMRKSWSGVDQPLKDRLQKVWSDDPDGEIGLTAGATHLLFSRNNSGAAQLAQGALNLNPKNVWAGRLCVLALRELGKTKEAATLAEELAGRVTDDASLWRDVGGCRLGQRQTERALVAFERAVTLSKPHYPEGLPALYIQALLNTRRADQAVRFATEAIDQRPDDLSLRLLQGFALLKDKQQRKAARVFEQAYRQDAAKFEAVARRLFVQERQVEQVLQLGRGVSRRVPKRANLPTVGSPLTPETKQFIARTLTQVPAAARAPLEQALLAAASGSPWSKIKPSLDKASAAAPRSPSLLLLRAEILVGRNVYPAGLEAIKAARNAVGIAPDELDLLQARLLFRRGFRAKGRAILERLRQRSGSVQACARALLHLEQGEFQEARAVLAARMKQGRVHLPSLELYAWALFGCNAFEESFEALYRQWMRRGALNGHMMTLSSLLGLAKALEMIRKQPTMAMSLGRQAMVIIERNMTVADGAAGRFAVCAFFLQQEFGGMIKMWVNAWIGSRLQEAKALEPDRAELWLLNGVLLLRSGSSASEVLEYWRRARKRDKLLRIGDWKRVFERKFGQNDRLDKLLRD